MILPLHLIFVAGAIIFCMLFKIAESAISYAEETEIVELADGGDKRAKRVIKLISGASRSTSPFKVAISTFEFLGAGSVLYTSGYLAAYFTSLGLHPIVSSMLCGVASLLIYITLTVVLVAIVSRHIALKNPTKTALGISSFAMAVHKIFTPFATVISLISKGILTMMRINPEVQDGKTATEEAIKNLVDTGSEHGMIDDEEKEFIENVFNFDDVDADEIATHRKEITILWLDETNAQWEKTIIQSHHTYFPICDEKIDNVVGVLNSKEYFRLKNKSRENIMKNAVKPPFYIPSSMKANAVLKAMKQKKNYFAVVIDEYGGLSGILTVTDLLECIVGEIFEDEDTKKVPDIEPLDSKNWVILGQASIDDVQEALDIDIEGDYDTFAGYVLTMMDAIPDDGTTLTVENDLMTVKVLSVKDLRIEKTSVRLKIQDILKNV